jgi:hypothetical protein
MYQNPHCCHDSAQTQKNNLHKLVAAFEHHLSTQGDERFANHENGKCSSGRES